MALLDDILLQLLQPYFFYPLVFLSISFLCIMAFLKLSPVSLRRQSTIWLIPLFIPALTMFFFFPQTMIAVPLHLHPPPFVSVSVPFQGAMATGFGFALAKPLLATVLSITGVLCLGGAVAALGYFVFTIVLGPRAALGAFHVVMMSSEDYPDLQESVKETAKKMGIPPPRVGLTEDLRPNAFAVGYGKRATLVFSLGILKVLDNDELAAVVSHELAHIKQKDYLFRSASYALNILSFFNPLSYFAASEAQKGRELLADEKGSALLAKPNLLAHVLEKIDGIVEDCPNEGLTARLSSGLFLVTPLTRRLEILAAHPKLAHRIQSINASSSRPARGARQKTTAVLLLVFLVCSAVAAGYAMVQLQSSFFKQDGQFLANTWSGDHLTATGYSISSQSGMHFSFPDSHGYGNLSTGPLFMNGSGPVVINGSGAIEIMNVNANNSLHLIEVVG